jgi:hypothetical protein
MEIQISALKEDLEKEHQRWRAAQANYERQVTCFLFQLGYIHIIYTCHSLFYYGFLVSNLFKISLIFCALLSPILSGSVEWSTVP